MQNQLWSFTRQHPPEVTGFFFAFKAFMQEVMGDSPRRKKIFGKLPGLGLSLGQPRWGGPGPLAPQCRGNRHQPRLGRYRQPEVKAIVNYIRSRTKKAKSQVVLGLDFHSTWYDVFYTNKERATPFPNFLDQWFQALERSIPIR